MQFIHSREFLNNGDVVKLDCDTQCNFTIMTDSNFAAFRRKARFSYYGGHFSSFPATIVVPSSGFWNIVIDLGGGAASIKYNLSVIRAK